MQKREVSTLDEAITVLLASLDSDQKNELLALIPNPRVPAARQWIDGAITMFQLDEPGRALCQDITKRFEDESVFVGDVFGNGNGIFEAEILLRETKYFLQRSLEAKK